VTTVVRVIHWHNRIASWTVRVEYAIVGALIPVLAGCFELSDRQTTGTFHRGRLFTILLPSNWLLVLSQYLPAVRARIKSRSVGFIQGVPHSGRY